MHSSQQSQQKHNVFISFHHKDEQYKVEFETKYKDYIISKSVKYGDIDPDNEDDYIKRLIQEDYISHSSILVALYGAETHERKHVDWEISAALSAKVGGHSGFVVMILPTFPISPFDQFGRLNLKLIFPYLHPRTVANIESGFANVYFWPGLYPYLTPVTIPSLLGAAFNRRITHKKLIDNFHKQYINNR